MPQGPLDRLNDWLPAPVREVVERETPIPAIAVRAADLAKSHPELVRADIGQISNLDPDNEVLYGPPVGLMELRNAVAESWNLTYGLRGAEDLPEGLSGKNVAITTGAAQGLYLLFGCFALGKTVGIPRGYWENYLNGVALAGGKTEVVDFFNAEGQLDLEGLAAAVDKHQLRALVANFPNNPVGTVLSDEEAQALARFAREKDLILICDEVYHRLRFDGQAPVTLLKYAPERCVVVTSASKEYLLPGARVGYVICAREALTDKVLRKMIRANTASPNVLGQRRLLEVIRTELEELKEGKEPSFIAGVRDAMKRRKEALVDVLEGFGFTLLGRKGGPMGTIFLMANLPDWWPGDAQSFAQTTLERHMVSVVPGDSFGLPDTVRFSYGGLTEEAIQQLKGHLQVLRDENQG